MAHPFVLMFHEEARTIIDTFERRRSQRLRVSAHDRRSLVVILRGMQGSGKSTFATMMKMYAEGMGLEAKICSADDFFVGQHGYQFNPANIQQVHEHAQALCDASLARDVPVIIIDNTNVTPSEWVVYERLQARHDVVKVNFRCTATTTDTLEYAHELSRRSWHDVPRYAIDRRFGLFSTYSREFEPDFTIAPIMVEFGVRSPDRPARGQAEHPMRLMFFDEVRDIVEDYMDVRAREDAELRADPSIYNRYIRTRQSLVVILRGLPGCGKTTFAMQTKLYGEAQGLRSQIFSTDHFFEDETGFNYRENELDYARAHCYGRVDAALHPRDHTRQLSVLIIDDQHLTEPEWAPFVQLASRHRIVFVNFWCGLSELAEFQALRSFRFRARQPRLLDHQWRQGRDERGLPADRLITQLITVEPIINTWFQHCAWNRGTQA